MKYAFYCKYQRKQFLGMCWERTQPNVLQSINFTKDYTLYLFFTLIISLHTVVTLLEYQYCHYIIVSSVRIYQIIKVC